MSPELTVVRWIVIGVVAFVVLGYIVLVLLGRGPVSHHKDFPTDSREANLLALGFQQINNPYGYWNDPTGSMIADDKFWKKKLVETWGLSAAADVRDNIERLTTERRRRNLWQQLLAIRAQASAALGGKRPSRKQWIDTVKQAGGSGRGDERAFIDAVHYYEEHIDKKGFANGSPVVSFDGYALGQAIAVSVWGVALGLISRDESLQNLERINAIARNEFASWQDFGRSFLRGRANSS